MILVFEDPEETQYGIPRESGDDPSEFVEQTYQLGYSPRERG